MKLTAKQRDVLSVMVWADQAWDMTTSEILHRMEQRPDLQVPRWQSVASRLRALQRHGLVSVEDDREPRRWRITDAGMKALG